MKKIIFSLISLSLWLPCLYGANVATLLDLYNVRNDLTGSYTQTADIDLKDTNPANVDDWSGGTSYSIGHYVKYSDGYTYICNTANSDVSWDSGKWTQLWESSKGWLPIGYDPDNTGGTNRFRGTFDGQTYTISNLYINRPDENNIGLFGHAGESGGGDGVEIKNVKLSNVTVYGARGTGSMIGRITGDQNTVTFRCSSNGGSVTGDAAVGGLVGSHNSYNTSASNRNFHPVMQECWAVVNVQWSQKDADVFKLGGLAGCNQRGRILNCYAGGSVTVYNNPQIGSRVPERIGGLAGCILLRGLIENSYSYGQVTTTGSVSVVGGFVGGGGTGGSNGNAYGCFYDQISDNPLTTPAPASGETSISGVTAASTADMKTDNTFINAGWNTTIWNLTADANGSYPSLEANPHAAPKTIALTNGSSFNPVVTPDQTNQAIGRFAISADGTGSALTRVTIRLDGTRSGAGNFKLWKSVDNNFESNNDTQVGETVTDDPGAGEYISFAFDESVSTSAEYYFLSCDVASDATGIINPYLEDNSSLTFFDGAVSTTIENSQLAANEVSLPVILAYFKANVVKGTVVLEWETSAEVENQGFILSRKSKIESQKSEVIADFTTDDTLKGQGSTTETTKYSYVDKTVEPGKTYVYTLADVDYEGRETRQAEVEVKVEDENVIVAVGYALSPVYPNPFNATLTVPFTLTEPMAVSIELYSLTGQRMMTVVNREFGTGSYNYTVQADDLASGIYLIKTSFGKKTHMQKAALLK